jgi:hypothetical protein
MRIRSGLISLAVGLSIAGCGTPAPASPGPSEAGSATTELPIATAGELYLVSYLDDADPFFGVRVEAVGPTGRTRPIATIEDVRPAGWEDASPATGFEPTIGPDGFLVLGVERNGGFEDADTKTLLVDVTPAGRPTVEIDGRLSRPAWGPSGALLALENEPVLVDPLTGHRSDVFQPDGIELAGVFLADGSGWVARRSVGETTTAGSLASDGTFTPGFAQSFQVTGLERSVGAEGGMLSMAISDGATESETAIVEFREDLGRSCHCRAWARFVEPGTDPHFGDAVWDRTGSGIWLTRSDEAEQWLSYLDAPLSETKVADLPPTGSWQIRGISPDDRWLVLGTDASEPGPLVLVDTAAGEARVLARPDASGVTPTFAGWVR